MEALDNDPETRPKFRALVKQKFPKAPIPEVDLDQRFEAHKTELRQELEAERLARKKDKDAADLAAARRSVMDDPELRITEEEIAEVEKIMQDPTLGPIASHKARVGGIEEIVNDFRNGRGHKGPVA